MTDNTKNTKEAEEIKVTEAEGSVEKKRPGRKKKETADAEKAVEKAAKPAGRKPGRRKKTEEAAAEVKAAEPAKSEETAKTAKAAKSEKTEETAKTVKAKPGRRKKAEKAEDASVKEEKNEAEVKTEAKKPGRRKKSEAAAAKPKEEAPLAEIFIQHEGREVNEAEIISRIKEEYVAQGHYARSIKQLKVYLIPNTNSVYYVINEKYQGRINMF